MIDDDRKTQHVRRRTLFLLAVATAIGSTGLAAGGTAGALLGAELAGTEAAGLPLGVLVVGSAGAALLVSRQASSVGRGQSLALGYLVGLIGAALVVAAAVAHSFAALLLGSTLLGAGNVAVFLARYAAADVSAEAARGRALGSVFFAAAVGSVFAPNLLGPSGTLAGALNLPPLTGLYLVAIVCFAIAALLLIVASHPRVAYLGSGAALLREGERTTVPRHAIDAGLQTRAARMSLLVLAATNLVMVAIMAIVPVHLVAHGHGLGLVGIVVGIHVAGMFVPSPLSGWAADRVGSTTVAGIGFVLLLASGMTGALVDTGSAGWMSAMLVLLGVGWNFGVVGGSTMLAASVSAPLRPHAEGIGEVAMGLAAGAGAPMAGVIVAYGGFSALSLVASGIAVATMLALALVWRWAIMQPGEP
jgi:MFS family permease